jgi:hypothetical protein
VLHFALDCWTTHHEHVAVPGHHHQSLLLLRLELDNQKFNIFSIKHPQPVADPRDSWFWRQAEFGDVGAARDSGNLAEKLGLFLFGHHLNSNRPTFFHAFSAE